MRIFTAAVAVAALATGTTAALAADADGKWISGELYGEIQNDGVYSADDDSEANDLYMKIESATRLHLTPQLRLEAGLVFEPVQDADPGDDRWFEDHGLYAETLQAVYEGDGWFVNAGKFIPVFAFEPDAFPGLYGDTLAESYELVERVGFGGGAEFAVPDVATFALTAAVFKRDTSFLNDSAFTRRDRLHESDGGPGNTDGLENFSLAFDVKDIAAAPGLLVRASLLRQGRGEGDSKTQWAYGLGAVYEYQVNDALTVAPMVDWVHSEDALGVEGPESVEGAEEDYLTAGVSVGYNSWNAVAIGGWRWDDQPGAPDTDDRFIQFSAGYEFENGIAVQAGWMHFDADGSDSETIGAQVSYGFEF